MNEKTAKEQAVEEALAKAKELQKEGMPTLAIQVEIKAFLSEHDVDEESSAVVLSSLPSARKKADEGKPPREEVTGRAEMIVGGIALAVGAIVAVVLHVTNGKQLYYALAGAPLVVGMVVLIKGYFDFED